MKILIGGMVAVMICSVLGCTSNPNAEKTRRPNYATMNTEILKNSNNVMWEVNCGDFKVAVSDGEFDDFYKEDGTQMTAREYCEFSRDRIRRRK